MSNLVLWQQIVELFLPLTKGSISTLSKSGCVISCSGIPPEQCTVRSVPGAECLSESVDAFSPSTIYSCVHGTRHLSVPLHHAGDKIGFIVLSYYGELSELQVKIMLNLAVVLPAACIKDDDDKVKQAQQLRHLSAFLPTLLSASDISGLCRNAANYLMHGFELANCAIIVSESERFRYNNNSQLEPVISVVEDRICASVLQAKTPVFMKDASKDFLTANIPNIHLFQHSLAAYPLVYNRAYQGALIVSFSAQPEYFELLCLLAEQLSLALSVLNRYASAADRANTDSLTKLPNRAALVEALTSYLPDAKSARKPSSLAVIDIDDFKVFNDAHGHLQGDQLLFALAGLMQEVLQNKRVFRYGGEEFVLFFPDTPQDDARVLSSKILYACPQKLGITVSIGIATCQNSSLSAYELLNQADKALYRAKNTGKNRIVHSLIVDKNLGVIDIDEAGSVGKYG